EPPASLNKGLEALGRRVRAGAQGKELARDVAGAVTAAAQSAQPTQTAAAAAAAKPAVVEGWVVRDVHRGTALLEGRMGLIEVDQGDVVPGLGRVEAIRKQDGRWVVLTDRKSTRLNSSHC